eukprot:jgi/Tetstr1/440105/TSEL_028463.t1
MTSNLSLVWRVQVGSPAAHALYPTIRLPEPVALFVEESGYFIADAEPPQQRVLYLEGDSEPGVMATALAAVADVARTQGVSVRAEKRFMNKANGPDGCPFLKHLVRGGPYIADRP